MTERKLQRELPKPLESFTRGLLATTCLTVACGVSATAGTITEGTPPAPADFPNTLPAYLLPTGTTVVNGFIGANCCEAAGGFDYADWFEFQGLTPGNLYAIVGISQGTDPFNAASLGENGIRVEYYSTSNTSTPLGTLDIGEAGGNPVTNTFTAPSDGNLLVDVKFACTECGFPLTTWAENPDPYTVSLAPEPGTLGAIGLGLGAVALAWRRRRAK